MAVRTSTTLALVVSLGAACGAGPHARDVAGDRRPSDGGQPSNAAIPDAPRAATVPSPSAKRPRLFARAAAHSLAIDARRVYYGDSENDAIYAADKAGGEPVRLARHAPVAGAISVADDSVVWIASPGDAVLRMSLRRSAEGGQPTTLRERGIFSDVATANGDVFITEAVGPGGALLRVSGATASRLASFEGAPRALVADGKSAYVITPTRILRAPHEKGDLETLATGAGFANPQIDEGFVYVLAEVDRVPVIARVPKAGGPLTTIARDVREAPFEVADGEVLFFDASRPQIRAVSVAGGVPRVILEDEVVAAATTLVADAATVYVATGSRESATIVAVDRR
jgi:hypothetical protein